MTSAIDLKNILHAGIGFGGMLVGGFVVFHLVRDKLTELETKIIGITGQLEKVTERYMTIRVCEQARISCSKRLDMSDARLDRFDAKLDDIKSEMSENFQTLIDRMDINKQLILSGIRTTRDGVERRRLSQ